MGTFNVDIEIGDLAGAEFVAINALVDTGSAYSVAPESLLRRLGVTPESSRRFELGDNRVVEYFIGYARMRLSGDSAVVPVVFAPEEASPLIGATTLEIFGLAVDPVAQRLTPVNALLR